jgi:hypothetical protein
VVEVGSLDHVWGDNTRGVVIHQDGGRRQVAWEDVRNAKDGKVSIGSTDIQTDWNVTGIIDGPSDKLSATIRRRVGNWLFPEARLKPPGTAGTAALDWGKCGLVGIGVACTFMFQVRGGTAHTVPPSIAVLGFAAVGATLKKCSNGVANLLEPNDSPLAAGVVLAIVNGDVEIDALHDDPDTAPTRVAGGGTIEVQSAKRRKTRKRKALRIPVLAGDVVSGLKLRHGYIKDTTENRILIRSDSSRRVEALRRDGDPSYVNLRNADLLPIVLHASKAFWIASDDEIDVHMLYKNVYLRPFQAARALMARACPNS